MIKHGNQMFSMSMRNVLNGMFHAKFAPIFLYLQKSLLLWLKTYISLCILWFCLSSGFVSSICVVITNKLQYQYRAPQAYFEGDMVKRLESELARSSKMKCGICGLKGAALGCLVKSCRKSYHLPCARGVSGCRWDEVSPAFLNL